MAASALVSSRTFPFEDDHLPPCPLEASFSSYLGGTTDSSHSPTLSTEFTHNTLTPVMTSRSNSMKKKARDDGELDVFGAEKYFSGSTDSDEQLVINCERQWKSSPAKEVTFPDRKTSSETSGHSGGSLLQDAKKDLPQNPQKPTQTAGGKKLLGIFCCSCIDNSCQETHSRKGWPETQLPEERKGRRTPSIDGSSSPSLWKEVLGASGLRRSLTTSATRDADACSESSSDLFEIEHTAATGTSPFGVTGASAMPFYEPSEASIEWSVATASTTNFSIMSEVKRSHTDQANKAKERQQQHQRPGGLLLGCVGDKAVSISPNTCKFPESMETADRRHRNRSMVDAARPVIRYHAESLQLVDLNWRRTGLSSGARGVVPAHTPCRHCPH